MSHDSHLVESEIESETVFDGVLLEVRKDRVRLPDGKEGPANVSVIKQLAYSGALFAKAKLKHSYPHSWRSKAPLIFRNTPQWFVAIDRALEVGAAPAAAVACAPRW